MGVNVRVDGVMVVAALAVGAGVYVYSKKKDIIDKVNPASRENLINQTVEDVVGEDNVATAADHVFGAIDLINPWAPEARKNYARGVYGFN